MDNELQRWRYWLALHMVPEVGKATIGRLLERFKTPEQIFTADIDALTSVQGVTKAKASNIKHFEDFKTVDNELTLIQKHNARIITIFDEEYPDSLRNVDFSPLMLYAKGNLLPDDEYAIAIVGSRDMSEYGMITAQRFAVELGRAGFTIVSGLARGIDSMAHRGAISVGARTIAVLGSGLARLYPRENISLASSIKKNGCVISEFAMQTPPNRENFPQRNRVISGMSMGVVIVEAVKGSGSLITAEYALAQGKEVFAIPGNINSPNSYGTNELIKKGEAKLVQSVQDIVDELSPKIKGMFQAHKKMELEISDEENAICKILSKAPKHIDDISRAVHMPMSKLTSLLLEMELKGLIGQLHGKKFFLV